MKLIYQQMLAFFFIIITSAAIIGYSVLSFASEQAYDSTFARLEGYADSLGELALASDGQLDAHFLDELQIVMKNDDVSLRVFDGDNNQIYPASKTNWQLPKNIWNTLQSGRSIHIKNDHQNEHSLRVSNKEAYSGVMVPWRHGDSLIGVVWLGAKVTNIEAPVNMAKNNLATALLITMIVGLILSYFLAYFTVNRINRLSRATKKVASGDFDVQLAHKDRDEIDELATDFNSMVQSLRKSNEEIARQEERRNQFMADAAHEMRTPLTTLNGILEGLQYDAIPEESKGKSIELMRNETNRLIRLVNENLDYEKIRNNQILLFKTEFDSVPVTHDILTQLRQKAQETGNELVYEGSESANVFADKDRFTQIMFNLIQNGLQFTQNGQVRVGVKRAEEQHATIFTVADNGIGMDKSQMHFIFDRFYKADPSRKKAGTGESGLGLSIVSSLVQQHGGKIDVQSKVGEGTTFTVTLYDDGFQQYVDATTGNQQK
ncbi:histidine kinase [Amylolactobacillus amylotrophicus DSM 20534]|uniref:Two-component sensor histidine kinase n=3 Tax=Amylolactobacillus TaxID=2767876 RepID=A0A1L6XDG5_9LACO|nr:MULTISPECIES: HAMP domain-containing sensor histidine kinase [Amylolactobacillus]APT19016.1 two-component sensor histidine kinase [Amylolactobacillus amylophilus DSM 20533 = JCM 1125]KRK38720.1 histidine kinase [Amylolactobacillus amylotrophicus DSM 20534]KRM42637.1 histidine kinase [Amylolactobacillus amylophilus DSM 20533 = JCM 1125]GED79938.1 two-component sensor histidine kinase [Amylolactobacillus amylophilus]